MMMQPLAALGVGIAMAIEIMRFHGVSGGITNGFGSPNEDFLENPTGFSAGSATPRIEEASGKFAKDWG
jgi:hypothetical protein